MQGVAAALLVPSTLALIIDTFSEQQRAAAIGTWTAWTGIATVAGPLLGGLLVQAASWRWVFVINVPLVLVTLWLVRHDPGATAQSATATSTGSAARSAPPGWRARSSR